MADPIRRRKFWWPMRAASLYLAKCLSGGSTVTSGRAILHDWTPRKPPKNDCTWQGQPPIRRWVTSDRWDLLTILRAGVSWPRWLCCSAFALSYILNRSENNKCCYLPEIFLIVRDETQIHSSVHDSDCWWRYPGFRGCSRSYNYWLRGIPKQDRWELQQGTLVAQIQENRWDWMKCPREGEGKVIPWECPLPGPMRGFSTRLSRATSSRTDEISNFYNRWSRAPLALKFCTKNGRSLWTDEESWQVMNREGSLFMDRWVEKAVFRVIK